jgi:hypothetical protein
MSTIVLDKTLWDRLVAAGGVADVRDDAGTLLGRVVAVESRDAYEEPELGIGEEELSRRLSPECKTYTTAEVLTHVRGLP